MIEEEEEEEEEEERRRIINNSSLLILLIHFATSKGDRNISIYVACFDVNLIVST